MRPGRHRLQTLALALVLVVMTLAACRDATGPRDPLGPTPPPAPPPPPVVLKVDYRVTGTIPNTRITFFSSTQGTTQVTTDLPWSITYTTTELHPFLYVGADSPLDNFTEGSIVVQIFVDGVLFREARGTGFVVSVAASGEVP